MAVIKNNSQSPYYVKKQNDQCEVCAVSGCVVMVCKDEGSAAHYASLLNDQYKGVVTNENFAKCNVTTKTNPLFLVVN